jgi:site-specific DNA-methyltransferase (adenine-specific)
MDSNKLYNMDFREGLNLINEPIMIVSDPPYNIKFKYNEYEDNLHDTEYIDMISKFKLIPSALIHYPEETMKYFVPALGVPDEVITWCYNSNLPRQSRLINFFNCKVDFTKVKQPYKNPNDKRVKKLIEQGSEGTRSYDWFSDIQMVKNVSKEKTIHPCPIPVKLMERIILLTTNENDLIVDPFMGTGTTAIACLNTNRRFIGFEIDKTYHEHSLMRINEHTLQLQGQGAL